MARLMDGAFGPFKARRALGWLGFTAKLHQVVRMRSVLTIGLFLFCATSAGAQQGGQREGREQFHGVNPSKHCQSQQGRV